ncbi:putative snare domain protein [Phaeomoniella chlamydospora]|uniref:t-SNARE affecting a late Golgi compartment protein 1 n=1 Tax=Phaeomoniella chlamydospora TaxID=158046 RepID=A0A0G2E5U5_PHACM|nr:putative snare domain protein [Phaeomoniella chlamydospora]
MEGDPFLEAQADALNAIQHTRSLFSSYLRIRSLAKSPTSPELVQSRSELQNTLEDLSNDLQDLIESVRAVENDPYRFGLDIDEVSRRRTLVNDISGEIESMRGELQDTVQHAVDRDGKRGSSNLPNPADFDNVHGADMDEDEYAEFEHQQQQEIMHEQDEQLDGVFRTVGNLRAQASDMGRELEEQAVMLDDVDTLADRVGGKLQNGMKKMGHIIRKNEGRSGILDHRAVKTNTS